MTTVGRPALGSDSERSRAEPVTAAGSYAPSSDVGARIAPLRFVETFTRSSQPRRRVMCANARCDNTNRARIP
ncbi:unnamed protein product, partial [Iphiclides podalirius]